MPYYFLILTLVLQLLPGCFRPTLKAQAVNNPAALEVGQPLPDNLPVEMVNYPAPTAWLSDFKGKLLILDFYATWCSSSREPLPRLDSLQAVFGPQLQVLLVSYRAALDSTASVESFLETWRRPDGTRYRLPSVVNDTALISLFPHRRIPHFVWISPEGVVGAITGPETVTADNIRKVITTGTMPASMAPDINLSKPLVASPGFPSWNMLHHTSLVKGKLDDGPARMQLRRQGDSITGAVFVNMPLLEMYKAIRWNLYPSFGDKGLVLGEVDSAALFPEKSTLSPKDWKEHHVYSYDLYLPPGQEENLYRLLLADLNRYSGYRAELELQETNCLLLVRRGRKDKLRTKGGEPRNKLFRRQDPFMQNQPISKLVGRLNSNNSLPLLVVDRTGYTGSIDAAFPSGFSSLPALQRELKGYGLALVRKRCKTPVLVLRPQQAPSAGQF